MNKKRKQDFYVYILSRVANKEERNVSGTEVKGSQGINVRGDTAIITFRNVNGFQTPSRRAG